MDKITQTTGGMMAHQGEVVRVYSWMYLIRGETHDKRRKDGLEMLHISQATRDLCVGDKIKYVVAYLEERGPCSWSRLIRMCRQ